MEAMPYTPPGAEHWLGTDNFGRDVFSRLVWGTRLALMVAIVSSAIASLLGVVLGSVVGIFRRHGRRRPEPQPSTSSC